MSFFYIFLLLTIALVLIRNRDKIFKSSTSLNNIAHIKLEEIAQQFNFLRYEYPSFNSLMIYDCDFTTLNIEIIDKHINIEINSEDLIECTPINVNLTLPFDIPMNNLLDKINQEMNDFMEEYRKISPNKQISFIDYLRHNTNYANISEYVIETIGVLEEIEESIKKNNYKELDNIIEDSELALENYNILCQKIIDIKADLTELIALYEKETETYSYKPIIDILEDIYKTAASLAKEEPNIAHILRQINDTSLYDEYQKILRL